MSKEVKDAVRARDGQKCTGCGMTADEHREFAGCTLHVHRVVPGSEYTMDGCVTFCIRCHRKAHRGPRGGVQKVRLVIRIPADLFDALVAMAHENRRSISAEAELALEHYLAEHEGKPSLEEWAAMNP